MKRIMFKITKRKNIMELFDFEWDKEKNFCFNKKKGDKLSFQIIDLKEYLIAISLNKKNQIRPYTHKLKINNSFLKNKVCYA